MTSLGTEISSVGLEYPRGMGSQEWEQVKGREVSRTAARLQRCSPNRNTDSILRATEKTVGLSCFHGPGRAATMSKGESSYI